MGHEKMIGPLIVEPGNEIAEPILFSKACRQLGIPSEAQPFQDDSGDVQMRVRLPRMLEETHCSVVERASFLKARESDGLPTEQLPSGLWPESFDEFADAVPVLITGDEDGLFVGVQFGRPLEALSVSPAVARTLAMLIMDKANELDPDGQVAAKHPELVNVARVKVPEFEKSQEGTVSLPSLLGELKTD